MNIILFKTKSWIPVLLLSLFTFCSEENGSGPDIVDNDDIGPELPVEEPIYLAGVWQLLKTVADDSCNLSGTQTSPQSVFIEDHGEYYQITDIATFVARGTLKEDTLNILSTERVDSPGCIASSEIIDARVVSRDTIEAVMFSSISDESEDCSDLVDCTLAETLVVTRVKDCNCPERAVFGDPDQSEYILPYRKGNAYMLTQSYCTPGGSHVEQLHYDFDMQVGDIVIAARAGIVRAVFENYPDDGYDFNYVFIEHVDGTVAFYAHLMQNSVIVSLRDSVRQGQYFAKSSRSGSPWFPHLHFGVYQNMPPIHGFDVPVNFRNAQGPLDECGGLVRGALYKATSWY